MKTAGVSENLPPADDPFFDKAQDAYGMYDMRFGEGA
jgi:hypothetical protein